MSSIKAMKKLAEERRRGKGTGIGDDGAGKEADNGQPDVEEEFQARMAAATAVPAAAGSDGAEAENSGGQAPANPALNGGDRHADTEPAAAPDDDGLTADSGGTDSGDALSAAKNMSIRVPYRVASELRQWSKRTGRTLADAILTAYLHCMDTVAARYEPTEEDKARLRLGLPLPA